MTFPLYHYKATCLRVVDGDSAHLRIDRGFREYWEVNCRLYGINAPELSTGEPGQSAKLYLYNALFDNGGTDLVKAKQLWIRSDQLDKYGRPLVTIWIKEPTGFPPLFETSINNEMIRLSLAVPYP